MAAAWKLLEDLVRREVGVNEVERDAWNRTANRIVKTGRDRPKKKGTYDCSIRRDKKYVGNLMKIRAKQAKDDWEQERRVFMNLKSKLMKDASTDCEQNRIRREVKKLKKANEQEFGELRRGHRMNIDRLEPVVRKWTQTQLGDMRSRN